jgi:Peptidase family C25
VKCLLFGIALLLAAASAQPYDHVTITAGEFVASFAPLGTWIESNLGMTDTAVTVEHIYANYPGRDNTEKVRNFIRYAYQDWGTTHVLLGGDVDVVPYRLAYVYRYGRTQNIPCDLYYADLDGDWDRDGDGVFGELEDSVDLYPDVAVGRVTSSTPAEAARFVSKVLTYASNATAPYLNDVLLSGFDLYDDPDIRG